MKVSDLIQILKSKDQQATVVLCDHRADEQPSIAKLGTGEVCEVRLIGIEEFCHLWLKLAKQDQPGSAPGVLLGDP
jgi:hypothetical protein